MDVSLIGAGNMGSSILKGLIEVGVFDASRIMVCSPNRKFELDIIKDRYNGISVSKKNKDAALCGARYIIIAVKPYVLPTVLAEIAPYIDPAKQTLVSIVAGVSFQEILEMAPSLPEDMKIVRVIPNIAISVGHSMTFVSHTPKAEAEGHRVMKSFNRLGKAMILPESQLEAATALASCGIAFVMRYMRAVVEGGVELGFYPETAKEIIVQTMLGAAEIIKKNHSHPEAEIDKVTTPGGITIRGLNAMEKYGFTTAVIEGLKACVNK